MNAIRYIRKQVFKKTQTDFAKLVGVTQSTVSRWENGDFPSLREMQLIRQAAYQAGLPWDDSLFFQEEAAA